MCYQTAHRLALNPSSGKESNNQSADGCWLVPEISFKCRLMNSEAGCADGRHTLTPGQTDLPRLKVKVCVSKCVERNWASNGTSKESNSARDARTLRAGPFIRDHQELMKHTERVIKQQTPTTAGLRVWHINHISVCRCLNLLFCHFMCMCVCMQAGLSCMRVFFACRHLPQAGLYAPGMFAFVREIAAAHMTKVPLSFLRFVLGYGAPPLWLCSVWNAELWRQP